MNHSQRTVHYAAGCENTSSLGRGLFPVTDSAKWGLLEDCIWYVSAVDICLDLRVLTRYVPLLKTSLFGHHSGSWRIRIPAHFILYFLDYCWTTANPSYSAVLIAPNVDGAIIFLSRKSANPMTCILLIYRLDTEIILQHLCQVSVRRWLVETHSFRAVSTTATFLYFFSYRSGVHILLYAVILETP